MFLLYIFFYFINLTHLLILSYNIFLLDFNIIIPQKILLFLYLQYAFIGRLL